MASILRVRRLVAGTAPVASASATCRPIGRARAVAGACLVLALAAPAAPARAALTCAQLLAVLQSTVQFRDQGYSLQQVLAGLKGNDLAAKLTAEELQVLRKSVTAVYLGDASTEQVVLACKEAQPGT